MKYPGIEGRVAMVTGGSRGIGAAVCRELARSGAKVALTYRSDQENAEALATEIQQADGTAVATQCDASKVDEVNAVAAEISQRWGHVELLVNNAGIFEVVSLDETTPEQWQRTLDVNLTGVYLNTWAVKDAMIREQFGRIVNVASIAGLRARPSCIAYAVSKAGVISFTKSVAEALAPHNIRINALAPGLIDTEMIADVDSTKKQRLVDDTPIQRLGTPEEMAATVMFLLSDLSNFTTGQTYVASGGRVQLP